MSGPKTKLLATVENALVVRTKRPLSSKWSATLDAALLNFQV
jgi:hypothetical protein